MDIAANTPQIIKIILLRIFANMIGAKHEAANLNDPWIIAWCSGDTRVFVCDDANCNKMVTIYWTCSGVARKKLPDQELDEIIVPEYGLIYHRRAE